MFVSFFPRPRLFFLSFVVFSALAMAFWYGFARSLVPPPAEPPAALALFWAPPELWFDLYFAICTAIFASAWMVYSPHPWAWWSIVGSALILFTSYFQVEVSVAINNWRGPFFNMIQTALNKSGSVTATQLYAGILTFLEIAAVAVVVGALTNFFVSHYVFRWRTAMNNFYAENWSRLRRIEGASQRVQEDTMRFATIMEDLGVSFVRAVLTLIAFLPILLNLSSVVTELPVVGVIPYPLVVAAILWSAFGTVGLALVGIRLPRIEFFNQRVEAAYRKELVIGEDDAVRADPPKLAELFTHVRRNYFRLYLNFMYFNVARIFYLQVDVIIPYVLLVPSIVAGKITLGSLQQIGGAFGQVRESFQYLINAWSTIVVLISIYQRLLAFEARMHDEPLAPIEARPESA